ncbi:MAG: type IX secretion system PorP/SprF family membrane protein [Saprospiraceae bacterium]|jgi:type IX secretion system PorP/SprF family membrane protein
MKAINTLFFCLVFLFSGNAQDGHYTQIFQNPLYLNPALIGSGQEAIRIGGIYRSQWQSIKAPYSNSGIFADAKIGNFALGFITNKSKAGLTGYKKLNALLAAGYRKEVGDGNNFLSIGAQIGLNQISIDPIHLTFDDQYVPGFGFDETLLTEEGFINNSMKMTDLNVGLAYHFDTDVTVPVRGEVGLAIYHANAPQATSFNGEIMDFPRKLVLHGSANFQVNKSFGLEPVLMIAGQGSAREFIYGLNLGFHMSDNTGFFIGVASRYKDAVLFTARVKIRKLTLGFGFDYSTSKLGQIGSGGRAMEVSMIYNIPLKSWFPNIADTDGDGILDRNDDCPEVPGIADLYGCPEELGARKSIPILGPDYDKDGILDENDLCPYESGEARFQGCNDQDADGIWDNIDVCPSLPGKVENHGCPVEMPGIDSDGDGVADRFDKCLYIKGLEEFNGCPDTDGDGISDLQDDCPYVKGTRSGNGCPENNLSGVGFSRGEEMSDDIVEFDTDKYDIKPRYHPMLSRLATLLMNNRQYKLVIEGHTDNEGNPSYNFQLSQRRALKVRDYLIERGADPSTIEVYHYGETKPTNANETTYGKARNRRVALILFK